MYYQRLIAAALGTAVAAAPLSSAMAETRGYVINRYRKSVRSPRPARRGLFFASTANSAPAVQRATSSTAAHGVSVSARCCDLSCGAQYPDIHEVSLENTMISMCAVHTARFVIWNNSATFRRKFIAGLSANFYGTNLTKLKLEAGGTCTWQSLGICSPSPAQPRMFGVKLRYDF